MKNKIKKILCVLFAAFILYGGPCTLPKAGAASLSKPSLRAEQCVTLQNDITFSLFVFSTDAVIYEKARKSAYQEASKVYSDELIALSEGAWVLYPLVYILEASFDNQTFYEVCTLPPEQENYTVSVFSDILTPLSQMGDFSSYFLQGATVYLRLATAVDLTNKREILTDYVTVPSVCFPALTYIRYDLGENGVNNPQNPVFLLTPPEADVDLLPPTREGYRFVSWQNDGQTVKAGTVFHQVNAQWEPKTYKIRYVLTTRGEYGFIHVYNQNNPTQITFGEVCSLYALTAPDGWVFTGWYQNPDFSGKPVTELTCNKEGDIVLYAEWLTQEESYRRQIQNEHWCDLDNDGKVSAADARLALRYAVHLDEIPSYALKRVDFYKQNVITANHARTILRVSVGLDDILDILLDCGYFNSDS